MKAKSKVSTIVSACLLVSVCMEAMVQTTVLEFSGKVTDRSGKGIAGVVVNNGVSFCQTNAQGVWILRTDTMCSKFVSISTPAAYVLPQSEGLAGDFYVPVGQIARKGGHTFVLEKRKKQSDDFHFVAISDPQVRNESEMKRWRQETVPDVKETVDSLRRSREVVVSTLGDLVFDNMALFDEYRTSLKNTGATVFQCIGNHDFAQQYQDLHNMAQGTPVYGEMVYGRYFGPTDYSYNIGKAHIVTMKNINYIGRKHYKEALTGAQIAWLKRDLSYVPKGSLVILNMHAACWNKVEPEGNVNNAAELKEVLADYKVHVFTGHTHFNQNNEVSNTLYEHNIGAACGAWWSGWVNQCGSPNGYMIVDVKGSDLRWHYKGTRRSLDYQFKLYAPGKFSTQSSFVVANVWDWDNACKVVWYQDGKFMGEMEQFTDRDETIAAIKKKRTDAPLTRHLFRAMPKDGAKSVRVEFTNRFGEVYTQSIAL